jgi:hypothetical protein
MADKISRVDDLDEASEATERIVFSVRGQDYEIDLTEEHAREFDEALERFVSKARRAQPVVPISRGRGRRQGNRGASREDIGAIRQWAQANGYDVSARGRIKKEVIEAYDQAHS